jgi:hypothetical protein
MTNAIDIIRLIGCIILTVLGLCCLVTGVVGVFRFKYALNRLHAADHLQRLLRLATELGHALAVPYFRSLFPYIGRDLLGICDQSLSMLSCPHRYFLALLRYPFLCLFRVFPYVLPDLRSIFAIPGFINSL